MMHLPFNWLWLENTVARQQLGNMDAEQKR